MAQTDVEESCALCGCRLHRRGEYGKPTTEGRSHATAHHHVAERFFGRSASRRGEKRERIFDTCPWGMEGGVSVLCFECHEELLHIPIFLPDGVPRFARLVRRRSLNETQKPLDRKLLGARIQLLHEVI